MGPQISIIIPVYNSEKYLDKCLASIPFPGNMPANSVMENHGSQYRSSQQIEVILVDDGSQDRSPEMCERWAANAPAFRVIHKENGGVSAARNRGLDEASGEYILFLDSDDELLPGIFEKCLSCMEQEHPDLLYFNFECRTDVGENYWDIPITEGITEFGSLDDRIHYICHHYFDYEMKFNVSNKLYKRSLIEQYHLRFAEGVKIGEDMEFTLRYLLICKKIMGIPQVFYVYWKHEGSAMAQFGNPSIRIGDFSRMLEKTEAFYRQQGCPCRLRDQVMIRTLDNQYHRKQKRSEYKKYVKEVTNRGWLLRHTIRILLQPKLFQELFGKDKGMRKWKDHLYILYCLVCVR